MKKSYLMLAAAAVGLLSACSNDDLAVKDQPQVQSEPGTVGFNAYLQRATTRAGSPGELKTSGATTGQTNLWKGFGVFAYYTDNNEYDAQTLPNFMYNQKVYKDAEGDSYWTYSPIVYWPNEYGQNAISDDNDKVTFFAYAPYVDFNPATGKIKTITDGNDQWGIVQASRNSATGDPWVKYIASFDGSKQVDLCWGVNATAEWNTVNSGIQSFSTGLPWLNVQRPREAATQSGATSASKVNFQFEHALSQLLVTVDTYADADDAAAVQETGKCRVFVRSITFSGFATKGMLNLNNTESNKALWLDFNGNGDLEAGQEVTVTDGRRDGKEGTSGGALPNEKGIGLNPDIVETEANYNYSTTPTQFAGTTGVDNTTRNIFRQWDKSNSKYVAMANTAPIYVIPTGEEVQVTIVYDVETIDPNLPVYLADNKTTGSCIENRITKTVNFGKLGMENGKKYTINLHLGLNSVKFDAAVDTWDDTTPKEIDLPSNKTTFAAAAGASFDFVLPATATAQTFTLTGFNGGESVVQSKTDGSPNMTFSAPASFPAALNATAAGEVEGTFTPNANETVKNQNCKIKWAGAVSSKQVELNLTQLARALGLGISAVSNNATEIELTSSATIEWATDVVPATGITVYRNGVKLTYNASPAAGQFGWDASTHKVKLPDAEKATTDEVFTITVKAGDAPAETKTVKVGS